MKERIFKNWKSSLMGVALLMIATAALIAGKCTLSEYAMFMPFVLGLIYVKDTIFKVNG